MLIRALMAPFVIAAATFSVAWDITAEMGYWVMFGTPFKVQARIPGMLE